jgi:hypothetical protein
MDAVIEVIINPNEILLSKSLFRGYLDFILSKIGKLTSIILTETRMVKSTL